MTDLELMRIRFSTENIRKSTGEIARRLGIDRKEFEAAVSRGMEQEAADRRKGAELAQRYLTVLEMNDWSVESYTGDGRVEIGKYSPAGEDFSICVSVEDFPEAVAEYSAGFDIDEHIEMWIEARRNGTSGVPSTRELVKDAEDIDKMLQELAAALQEVAA